MGSSTAIFPTDYAVQMAPWLMKTVSEAEAFDAKLIWDVTVPVLLHYWFVVFIILALVLLYALLFALTTRRWRILGRVLYSYLHLGILFVIGLIWGPAIYVNDYFEIINFLVYAFSFEVVGIIVKKMGLSRRW
jgi:hypothetical protein